MNTKETNKFKTFFSNLVMSFKVQKGALTRVAIFQIGVILISVVISALSFKAFDNSTIGYSISLISFLLWLSNIWFILRHDYKLIVERSAEIIIEKAELESKKAQKIEEKAKIKSQNQTAYANRVKQKYKNK